MFSISSPPFLNALVHSGKGEECIPQTWDIFHEKCGFMFIFWNFAGIPFVRFGCPWHADLRAHCYFSHMHTLSSTCPHIIHLSTNSLLQFMSCCSQPSSLHTACKTPLIRINALFLTMQCDSWDTSMAQKSHFKMQTQGITKFRSAFPQLPWGTLKNPEFIQTIHG